jgi:5-methylthioadenosine/S-adenosylhomocysteine deaminase
MNVKPLPIIFVVGLLISLTVNPLAHPVAQASELIEVDLIIEGDHVVTMDAADTVILGGAIAVDKGVIVAIGTRQAIRSTYRAIESLSGENRVVLPGLINGHSHAAMTLLRGIADDLSLFEWLNEYIFPAEVAFVDEHFVRVGTELACWEMIRGGTTTFVDMYYFSDTIAEVVESCGMRALISATVIDQKSPDANNAVDSLAKGREFVERWRDRSSRITPIFGPHAIYTLSPAQLKSTRKVANDLGVGISIHIAESRFEQQYARDTYGMDSVSLFESIDFFNGPTIAAHMVWPTQTEIALLARREVGVIYNPTSNMKTAAGVSPVLAMLEAGVNVGIGTDGAASNNDLDMWEEMRLAALLQKIENMDAEALGASTVLSMATRGGAKAIGLAESIGSLEVGKRADLIQVAFDDVHHVPVYDIISHLVYVTDEQDVDTVIIDGKVVMKESKILTIDTDRVRLQAITLAAKIQARLADNGAKKSAEVVAD